MKRGRGGLLLEENTICATSKSPDDGRLWLRAAIRCAHDNKTEPDKTALANDKSRPVRRGRVCQRGCQSTTYNFLLQHFVRSFGTFLLLDDKRWKTTKRRRTTSVKQFQNCREEPRAMGQTQFTLPATRIESVPGNFETAFHSVAPTMSSAAGTRSVGRSLRFVPRAVRGILLTQWVARTLSRLRRLGGGRHPLNDRAQPDRPPT